MRTLKLIGMALLAIVMCVNFTACSDDDEPEEENSTTNINKAIIGTWAQDGDDDIMVVESNGKLTFYENENDYKEHIISDVYTWNINNEWLKCYFENKLEIEARPKDIKKNKIIWKRYDKYNNDFSDSFGTYNLWTWERYTK